MLLDLPGCWCSGAQGLNVQATDEAKSPFPVSEVFPWNSVPLAVSTEPDAPPGVSCGWTVCGYGLAELPSAWWSSSQGNGNTKKELSHL